MLIKVNDTTLQVLTLPAGCQDLRCTKRWCVILASNLCALVLVELALVLAELVAIDVQEHVVQNKTCCDPPERFIVSCLVANANAQTTQRTKAIFQLANRMFSCDAYRGMYIVEPGVLRGSRRISLVAWNHRGRQAISAVCQDVLFT